MEEKNQEIVVKSNTSLHNEDWYLQLLEDCQSIKVERAFNASMEILQGNWELGQRISKENENMKRSSIYGEKVIETLSNDLGKSSSHLWKCVQVYQHYETDDFDTFVSKLPDGKAITWTKALKSANVENEAKPFKEKTSFKLDEIVSSFKEWLIAKGTIEEDEILQSIVEFKRTLQEHINKK